MMDLLELICFLSSESKNLIARDQIARETYNELVINNSFPPFPTHKHENYNPMGNFSMSVFEQVLYHSTFI